ncbi:MAG TPA: hypothetical protein ENJ11_05890 [Gammaproteobacteria bacterium]|nr:hypothetical protein [Gammaproteobacteria bacterium]
MKLNIIVDGRTNAFEVPDELLIEAQDFFDKLDADMDKGWQMSREWVENPTPEQRCQIAGDRILTAIETENEKLLMLMAAYILHTLPGIKSINIDITGDMNETDLIMEQEVGRPLGPIFS